MISAVDLLKASVNTPGLNPQRSGSDRLFDTNYQEGRCALKALEKKDLVYLMWKHRMRPATSGIWRLIKALEDFDRLTIERF
jgi:hypothetical protein